MTRRHRWLIPCLAAAIALVIRLWMSTMRVRIVSADGHQHPSDPALLCDVASSQDLVRALQGTP